MTKENFAICTNIRAVGW